MKRMVGSLEGILVSFCVILMVGYHGYLWYCFKKKPFHTTIGTDVHNRRIWFLNVMKDVEKNGMLGVQTLRNTQMVTILTASFAIILNTALAALINNSYKATHLFEPTIIMGSTSGEIFALKYGLVSFTLLLSFFSSSVALAFFMDANVLINVLSDEFSSFDHTKMALGRGSLFALIGNRLLLIAFPLVLWAFGPFAVVLSSLGLVWWLRQLDFIGK